jgi:O-antigen/teichoic acid export membrane protein
LITFPIALLNLIFAPMIARLHVQKDHQRQQRLLTSIAVSMTFGVFLLSAPFYFAGESMIAFVFGDEYAAANSILLVLCVSALVNGMFGASAALLNMTGRHKRVTRASAIALASLMLSLPLLVWTFGTIGAAIASVFGMIVWNVVTWFDAKRLLDLDTSVIPILRIFPENA